MGTTIKNYATPLLALVILSSCELISGDNVKQSIPQTGLSYEIAATADTSSRTVTAEFINNNGDISYSENNKSINISVDDIGNIRYLSDNDPEILFQLIAFSPLPDKNTVITKGLKWTKYRPTDAEIVQMSNSIVGQEKVEYEVISANNSEIVMNIKGEARLINNNGLAATFVNAGVPDSLFSFQNIPYTPYAIGTITFDVNNSRVKNAKGSMSLFGYLLGLNDTNIAASPYAIDYKITLK